MIPLSILDLAPILAGASAGQALKDTLTLARHAEKLGFHRFWLAEHHNMPGIASAATAVVIAHVAGGTSTIRVGAGGIMLPNHAPLIVAEQFGTLDALFPGRIDLGLGRAPGTDPLTSRALRRNLSGNVEDFPADVTELIEYFDPAEPAQPVQAVPGAGAQVEVWILGSSLYGAQLAAALGLPYAFASHFAPGQLMRAIEVYRAMFRPSARLAKPRVMVGTSVVAADTDAEARTLATSMMQMFVQLRRGRPGRLPPPIAGFEEQLAPPERALLGEVMACSFAGSRATVQRGLEELIARTGADELMITSQIYEEAARLRSYEIVAAIAGE